MLFAFWLIKHDAKYVFTIWIQNDSHMGLLIIYPLKFYCNMHKMKTNMIHIFSFDADQTVFTKYRKVMSSKTSHLEAQERFFRLLMTGIFDPYVL